LHVFDRAFDIDKTVPQASAVQPETTRARLQGTTITVALMSVKYLLAEKQPSKDKVLVVGSDHRHAVEELEGDLSKLRHLYYELGQRASALASERDAARAKLDKETADILCLQRELEAVKKERDRRTAEVKARLEQIERDRQAREGQLLGELDDLNRQLEAIRQTNAGLESEKQALSIDLNTVQQELTAARTSSRERIDSLEQGIAEIASENEKSLHRLHELEVSLTDTSEQQTRAENQVRTLEEKLCEERRVFEKELNNAQSALVLAQDDIPGQQRHWKMTAAASLFVGTAASALAYWGVPEDLHEPVAVNNTIPIPDRHQSPIEVDHVIGQTGDTPSVSLAMVPPTNPATDDQHHPDQQSTLVVTPDSEPQRSKGTAAEITRTSVDDQHAQTGRKIAEVKSSLSLQATARESLRTLNQQAEVKSPGLKFDPLVREQQSGLIALGFDLGQARADGIKGRRTQQALYEFQQYYLPAGGLPEVMSDAHLASVIKAFADVIQNDRKTFEIDSEVLAAIRLGSLRTGVEFPYLMELAFTESSFDPAKKAGKSSATGLYQFTDATWLNSIKAYGDKYGLGIYASQVEHITDAAGRRRAVVRNPVINRHILALRYDPGIATLLAAEFTLENEKLLARFLGRPFGRTELYLTHFFGIEDALEFLNLLEKNPARIAAASFPEAAESNPGVFHPLPEEQRTVEEIYRFFDKKFNTGRYEVRNPGLALIEKIQQVQKQPNSETPAMSPLSKPAPS
jgi:peptidoglycan hydrolase-like protein with peptidoglycan-binding domain